MVFCRISDFLFLFLFAAFSLYVSFTCFIPFPSSLQRRFVSSYRVYWTFILFYQFVLLNYTLFLWSSSFSALR
uniref:Putative secreted peptide n=1 Tax=Anopheles braziliensis TaxID=58242 RepID=A0A2M3ZN05_9DIPT